MLYGRSEELAVVARLLEGMRRGRAGVLALRGEAGIGKTALLDAAAESAADARVLRVAGLESEAELPFAALHALLRPVLDKAGELPERQGMALRGAFGMAESAGADRFGVGLATLSLVAELAEDRPVVCLVDDAQWLDRASADALIFAARRLYAERAAVIFAARDEPPGVILPGLPELRVSGLDRGSAVQLLGSAGLASVARDQLIAEADGNPLALIELCRGLSAEQRAWGFTPLALPAGSPLSQVQAVFAERIAALPEASRRAVLIAALDGTADLAEVSRAIDAAGGSLTDLAPAERAGIARVTPAGITFSHPLARAAVRAGADVAARMVAHRALAGVLDDDRRAWHRAALATGPDEQVAAELDAAARRAGERGSPAAMSAAYEKAAELSASPAERGLRLILAVDAAAGAGQMDRGRMLARRADPLVSSPRLKAALARVNAVMLFQAGRPAEAAEALFDGAALLDRDDSGAAQAMVARGVLHLWLNATDLQAALAHPGAALTPLAGQALRFTQALWRLQDGASAALELPESPAAGRCVPGDPFRVNLVLFDLVRGDLQAARDRAAGLVAEYRETGLVSRLAHALTFLAFAQSALGERYDGQASASEGLWIAADTGLAGWSGILAGVAGWLAAMTGDEQACRALAEDARTRSAGVWSTPVTFADWALARLDVGLGRYQGALDRLQALAEGPARHHVLQLYACPDHVEAAVRAGRPELAAGPLARLTAWAQVTGQPWVTAVAARCAALVADDHRAEMLYCRAVAAHEAGDPPLERARTSLAYGEWLRRHQRRADAREHLLAAATAFARLGARPWQDRTEAALRAVGAAAPSLAADDPLARLTPQELQVVRLAAAGASNKQVAAALFLSPRTVGYHLYKAFPKLGVTSRDELARYALCAVD
jgi:DNA-binding CsgD family transcriptional regulator